MEDIKFDEPTYGLSNQMLNRRRDSFLTRLVLRSGIVKDRKQVTYVLLGMAIAASVLGILIFATSGSSNSDHIELPPGQFIPK